MQRLVLHERWGSAPPNGRYAIRTTGTGSTVSVTGGLLRLATGTDAFGSAEVEHRGRALPPNCELRTKVTVPTASGGGLMFSFRGMYAAEEADWTIHAGYQVRLWPTNTLTLYAISHDGSETVLGSATVTITATNTYGIRVVCKGQWLRVWCWNLTGAEPMVPTIQAFNGLYNGGRLKIAAYTNDTTSENFDFGPLYVWDIGNNDGDWPSL